MSLAVDRPLEWANGRSPDRIVLAGRLGVRPLRHTHDLLASPPAIEGLRVKARGQDETPVWHETTGIYGFIRVTPGPHRVEIVDPKRRWLPAAFAVVVPDRSAVVRALEEGTPPPGPPPAMLEPVLRPGPAAIAPPGVTVISGIVTDAGRPVALARLSLQTVFAGVARVSTTWSDRDGGFTLVLAGEKPSALTNPPTTTFNRALTTHAPKPALRAGLAAADEYVAALPADLAGLDPNDPTGAFEARSFRLRSRDGVADPPGVNPNLPVLAGRRRRWDVELLP